MIETDASDGIAIVTMVRPSRRNALTPDDLDALETAIRDASEPVVLLRGANGTFSAGADLAVVRALDREAAVEFARQGQRAASAIETADSVIVAGIDGPARGGGIELALACDLRVGTPDATFAEPGVTFGLFGAWGGTVRLSRILGLGHAMDFALSGRVIDAEHARRIGLISRIVDDPRAVARELAGNEPDALAVVKDRLRDDRPVDEQEAAEAAAFADLVARHGETAGR